MSYIAFAVFISLALSAGCGSAGGTSGQSIDIELMPDRNLDTPAQVLARTHCLCLILDNNDTPDGLYPPGSPERDNGNTHVRNADGDPALEVVTTVPVGDHLPTVELRRGSLPDVPLDITVRGLAACTDPCEHASPVAVGGAPGVTFADGPTVSLPFNLLSSELPPRVALAQGARDCGSLVHIELSKCVETDTLAGNVEVDPASSAIEVKPIEGGCCAGTGTCPWVRAVDITGMDTRTGFTVTVSPGVMDADGQHLDQVPGVEGDQPFVDEVSACPAPSRPDLSCATSTSCPAGLSCVDSLCQQEIQSCDQITCAGPQLVCAPTTLSCVFDCRLYGGGSCPSGPSTCDSSGVCM